MGNKKNYIFIIIFVILFIIFIYIATKKESLENKTYEYLETKGCNKKQIKDIKVNYSFINSLLSYDAWSIKVNLYNRYEYIFTYKNKMINLSGLNDKGKLSKEEYQELVERLETSNLCTKEENMKGEKSEVILTNDKISLKVKNGSLTNTSATLIFTNHTDETYIYGEGYHIEYEENSIWYKANPVNNLDINYIAHYLHPQETIEITVDWSVHYEELIPKKYRIIKSAIPEKNSNNQKYLISTSAVMDIK